MHSTVDLQLMLALWYRAVQHSLPTDGVMAEWAHCAMTIHCFQKVDIRQPAASLGMTASDVPDGVRLSKANASTAL